MGIKISNLPAIVTPALADIFPVVQSGVTYKETFTQLSSLFATSGANANITSLSGLTTPLSIVQGGTGSSTGDVTFASLAFNPNTKGIVGTPTNDSAGVGYVGEYKSTVVLTGAAIAMTDLTAANIAVLSLTAGDWDVWGTVWSAPAGGTTTSIIGGSISKTSATLVTTPVEGGSYSILPAVQTAGVANVLGIPVARISFAATTNVYLVGYFNFAVSTLGGYGSICARRVR